MDLNEARFKLNKTSRSQLYYQVKRMVLNEIANGNLKLGDKLPAEIEFCESLQISRPTVRLALNELVAEGILVRKKRSGTFVAEPKTAMKSPECGKLPAPDAEQRPGMHCRGAGPVRGG